MPLLQWCSRSTGDLSEGQNLPLGPRRIDATALLLAQLDQKLRARAAVSPQLRRGQAAKVASKQRALAGTDFLRSAADEFSVTLPHLTVVPRPSEHESNQNSHPLWSHERGYLPCLAIACSF